MMDPLSAALCSLNNASRLQKRTVLLKNISPIIRSFLLLMQKKGYVDDIEFIDDHRVNKAIVKLNGRINKCGSICPRYEMSIAEIERKRGELLPARQFGHVVVTTDKNIIDHQQCIEMNVGGRVIGYFY